jgi:hypothetical protein
MRDARPTQNVATLAPRPFGEGAPQSRTDSATIWASCGLSAPFLWRTGWQARTARIGKPIARRVAAFGRPPRARQANIRGCGKNLLRRGAIRTNKPLPNTHVPVVACRSAGIWTRGQLTALARPAAGGEPANPAQRGTRLEATTDGLFWSLPALQRLAIKEACLSCRACGRDFPPSKRWLMIVSSGACPRGTRVGYGSSC